jgi:hypothetical protein
MILLTQLTGHAAEQGATLVPVMNPKDRFRLAAAIDEAANQQDADPIYASELATWTGRSRGAVEGVPAANVPVGHGGRPSDMPVDTRHGDTTMRTFDAAELAAPPEADEPDAAELLVLATASDDEVAQLRAGEALSAVLLAATDFKLATCPLSQPLEVRNTRAVLRDRVLDGSAEPQIVLRVGWAPPANPPVPASPRRSVDEVLDGFPPRR